VNNRATFKHCLSKLHIAAGDATIYDENGPLSGNPTVPSVMPSAAAAAQAAAAAPAADKALAPGEIAGKREVVTALLWGVACKFA
jgi:hypothetical protein